MNVSLHNVVSTEVITQSVNGVTWTTYKFTMADDTCVEVTAFHTKGE